MAIPPPASTVNTNVPPQNYNGVPPKQEQVGKFNEALDRLTTSNDASGTQSSKGTDQSQGTSNSYQLPLATRPPINLAILAKAAPPYVGETPQPHSTGNQDAPEVDAVSQADAAPEGAKKVPADTTQKTEPDKPAPDAKKPDNNDPQATTATGVGYNGASSLNSGQTNVTIGGGYSPIAGGGSGSVQIGSGLHDFSEEASVAAQVQANRDSSGNLGVTGYVNPFYSPKESFLSSKLHLNVGLYVGGFGIEGQRPPGETGAAYGASGVAAGEVLISSEKDDRDHPWLTLGGNVGVSRQDRAHIAAAGADGPNPPQTYLKDATTVSATGSAQLNLDYYKAGAGADADTSKTPRWVLAAEATYSHIGGTPYSDATTQAVQGSSTSYAAGVAAQRNWRLDSGHTILSAGANVGVKHEDDTIGNNTSSSTAPYAGVYIGGSFGR